MIEEYLFVPSLTDLIEVERLSKYTNDEFQARIKLSQKMFHQIENYLSNFLGYVPLDFDHLKMYSLKLVTVILETGPELLNSFDLAAFYVGARSLREVFGPSIHKNREKLLEKEMKLRRQKRSLSFKDYYSFLDTNETPKLSRATIVLRDLDVYITPFKKVNPEWWESYNLLRHDKYNNLKKATLRNALKASGALFWLVDLNSRRVSVRESLSSSLFIVKDPYEIDESSQEL